MKILWTHKEERHGLPDYFPDALLSSQQADLEHGQTLERLNERGGMGIEEIVCNITGIRLTYQGLLDHKKCCEWLIKHLAYKGYHI